MSSRIPDDQPKRYQTHDPQYENPHWRERVYAIADAFMMGNIIGRLLDLKESGQITEQGLDYVIEGHHIEWQEVMKSSTGCVQQPNLCRVPTKKRSSKRRNRSC